VPRNGLLDGPGYVNVDATLTKLIPFRGDARAEFRIDVFNLFNTPHFNNPNAELGNANFGRVTTVIDRNERQVLFGLKLTF
jgi:hypothetical protein